MLCRHGGGNIRGTSGARECAAQPLKTLRGMCRIARADVLDAHGASHGVPALSPICDGGYPIVFALAYLVLANQQP
jgi:hypothetical protein